MKIHVDTPKDVIQLIFYKILFNFDELMPGDTILKTGNSSSLLCSIQTDQIKSFIGSALKLNEAEDKIVIGITHVIDKDDEACILIDLPMFTESPRLCVHESENGIAIGGNDACEALRKSEENSEEKEAFEFLVDSISKIVAECTGN